MGNEQSAPTPRKRLERPANKLSKPRTNNHSSANLLERYSVPPSRGNSVSTNGGSPVKNRDSVVPVDVLLEAVEERKERRGIKRMSLFRSKSAKPLSQEEVGKDVEDVSVDPSPIEHEPTHRWSREPRVRTNSVTSQSTRARSVERAEPPLSKPAMRSRMSLQTYTHHPRLSLVHELPSPPSQPVQFQRLSRYEEEPAQITHASRTNSESALYTPIRRRSLLQHGVATRTSFVEGDPRGSLPSQASLITLTTAPQPQRPEPEISDEIRNYYYDTSKPTSSPLTELALLGPNPEYASIGPRTETPTELEHIGAFKLGSLRITNGAASPVPSMRSANDEDHDYICAGNARRSQDRNRSQTSSMPAEPRKAPWISAVRAESPLRYAHQEGEKPLIIDTQIPIPSPSLAWFNVDENNKERAKRTESSTKALELAKDYQQDLALSPFSFENSPLSSPRFARFESTSKTMAVEDDLFSAEPDTPTLSERAPRSFDSAYDNGVAPKRVLGLKGMREQPPKPLAKADSGYSSNISLRSFKRQSVQSVQQQVEEKPATPTKDIPSRIPSSSYSIATQEVISRVPSSTYSVASRDIPSRVPSSTYSINSASAYSVASANSDLTLRMKRSLPSIPSPQAPMREAPPVPVSASQPLERTFDVMKEYPNPPTPDKDHVSSPGHNRRKSAPSVPRNSREESPSTSSLSSTSTSTSTSSRWSKTSRKDKKLQPLPQLAPHAPFTLPTSLSPTNIPAPSISAQRHLSSRVQDFPVVNFPNTYQGHIGLRKSSSKETLGTIFSVGSAEVRSELDFKRLQSKLPAVPPPTIEEHQPVVLAGPEMVQTVHVATYTTGPEMVQTRPEMQSDIGFQQPRPASHRKPVPVPISNHDLESSYSTVSESLDKSPYVLAATSISRPRTNRPSNHGHSRTNPMVRVREGKGEIPTTTVQRVKSYDQIPRSQSPRSMNGNRRSHPPQAHAVWSRSRESLQPLQQRVLIPLGGQFLQSRGGQPLQPRPEMGLYQQGSEARGSREQLQTMPKMPLGGGIYQQAPEERGSRLSMTAGPGKSRSPPPVSMATQRKATPILSNLNSRTAPNPRPLTSETSQIQSLPLNSRPGSSSTSNRRNGNGNENAAPEWTTTASLWASRRKSAGENLLHTRRSMEIGLGRPLPSQIQSKTQPPSPAEAQFPPQQALKTRKSWNVGVGYEESDQSYSHAYGLPTLGSMSSSALNSQHNSTPSSQHRASYQSRAQEQEHEQEYYEQPNDEYYDDDQAVVEQSLTPRKTSTSDMLVLDRFSGGLDYGYEHGVGFSGSSGTMGVGKGDERMRKSVVSSEVWGVDLSDVPVILQRVRV